MSTYQERKQARKEHFEKYVKGWKIKTCTACSVSGFYDFNRNGRTPKCSSCGGTGKEKCAPEKTNLI